MKEKMFQNEDLRRYRKKVDKIDDKLLNLLNKRGKTVLKIGKIKKKAHMVINQSQREEEIIERIKLKSIILEKASVENIWREIIHACKLIQSLKVTD
ncbi:MAG: chorismate mutase [Promethearchaeota archaeon]|nr:MAG: chorismate mutase [Candidatus Lokiarchaeota archaeon]